MLRSALTIALLVFTASVHAQTTPDATLQARAHFQAGLARAEQGDLSAALTEFETAYSIRPHFSVLYNIGQARSTLGRPVEAVAAFERYLADGGQQVAPNRRQEVETLLLSNRKRIGSLRLLADARAATRVWVDGVELGRERLATPIALAVGEHSVVYTGGDGPTESQVVSVTSGEVTDLKLAVTPPKPPDDVAQLAIICETPGLDVDVNGERRTQTPLTVPLLVPSGQIIVRLSRPGYHTVFRTLTATPAKAATLRCDAKTEQPLAASLSARLLVRATPADAEIKVDGERFLGAPLPSGVHRLLVERDGFRADERVIALTARKTTTVDAKLTQTPAARDRDHSQTSRQKTVAIILGSVGVALVGTGTGMYTWNSGRYDDWRSKQTSPGSANTALAASVQRADDIALGLILAGAGAAIAGTWTFLDAKRSPP